MLHILSTTFLSLLSLTLLPLSHLLHPLLLQELLLRLGIQTLQGQIPLQLLGLLTINGAFLGLLILFGLLKALDGVVAGELDLAHDFGAEVGAFDQGVGETEEVGEDGEDGVGGGWELGGQVDALLGHGLIDSVRLADALTHGEVELTWLASRLADP